jgi:hypothetical protein
MIRPTGIVLPAPHLHLPLQVELPLQAELLLLLFPAPPVRHTLHHPVTALLVVASPALALPPRLVSGAPSIPAATTTARVAIPSPDTVPTLDTELFRDMLERVTMAARTRPAMARLVPAPAVALDLPLTPQEALGKRSFV